MIGGSFCEVNRRRRSRRGIRKNFPQSSDRSQTLDASVFCFYTGQSFGLSKCHCIVPPEFQLFFIAVVVDGLLLTDVFALDILLNQDGFTARRVTIAATARQV